MVFFFAFLFFGLFFFGGGGGLFCTQKRKKMYLKSAGRLGGSFLCFGVFGLFGRLCGRFCWRWYARSIINLCARKIVKKYVSFGFWKFFSSFKGKKQIVKNKCSSMPNKHWRVQKGRYFAVELRFFFFFWWRSFSNFCGSLFQNFGFCFFFFFFFFCGSLFKIFGFFFFWWICACQEISSFF